MDKCFADVDNFPADVDNFHRTDTPPNGGGQKYGAAELYFSFLEKEILFYGNGNGFVGKWKWICLK